MWKSKAAWLVGCAVAMAFACSDGVYALAPNASAHDETCRPESIVGTWLTEPKDAKVEVYKDGSGYNGKIIWLKEPNGKDGKPKVDEHNPDKAKRNAPVVDLVNVRQLKYDSGCKWNDGKVYDPKVGKTYDANAELEANGQNLDLRGYIGISLFGHTTTWHRVK